jgi:putative membrane protein
MIDYDPKNWLAVAFSLRGSIAPRLLSRVAVIAAIGFPAALLHAKLGFKVPPIAHTLIGVALGLLLVFRTNASYDRYWEGRKLLGAMNNRARDLLRQVGAYVHADEDAARYRLAEIRRYVVAFFALSVQSLRSERDLSALGPLLDPEDVAQLEPARGRAPVVLMYISAHLRALEANGKLLPSHLLAIDANLTAMMDALGGCERIARTPVPFAYAQHIKAFVLLFLITIPFAMVDAMRWYTPIAAAVLAFALFGIDEIGVEIEDPFGDDPNDLPIDRIQDNIDANTREILAASLQATSRVNLLLARND